MLELYHAHRSTCSQKVRICLAELGLEFRSRPINLIAGEQLTPAYLAVNPNGVVPALMHDGAVILESSVICEYLCEVFPGGERLLGQSAVERARIRAWLHFIDEVPSMAVRVPSFQSALLPFFQRMAPEDFERFIEAMPVRKYFYRRMGQTGFSREEHAAAVEQLERSFARIDRALAQQDWLAGARYSIADICVAPVLQRLEDLELGELWSKYRKVARWFELIRGRPAFLRAFYPGSGFKLADIRALIEGAPELNTGWSSSRR